MPKRDGFSRTMVLSVPQVWLDPHANYLRDHRLLIFCQLCRCAASTKHLGALNDAQTGRMVLRIRVETRK